jgi:hypothetical protein
VVDLSKRGDGHKTSKHYGPFHGELPTTLNGVLDSYRDLLAFECVCSVSLGSSMPLFGRASRCIHTAYRCTVLIYWGLTHSMCTMDNSSSRGRLRDSPTRQNASYSYEHTYRTS